jgi:transposase
VNETPQPQDLPTAQAIIGTLTSELQRSQRENDRLKRELETLLRRLYGPKSEKIDPRQLRLLLEGMGTEVEKVVEDDACEIPRLIKARKGKSKGRQALPKSLPRERRVVDIPEAEKQCSCGKTKVKIGSAVSEKLDFVPASFRVIETETLRYACPKCHEGVSVAKAPAQAVEKGLAAEGLLAYVAVSKYADHLPLHRQHRIYERHGVDLSVSTLCDFVEQVATATTPIVDEIKRQILGTQYLQTDETSVTVLDEPQGRFKGRLWVYLDPIGRQAVFDATPTRERDGPETFLRDFRGKLQADAYSGYDALFRGGGMEEIGCWAHARRRFVEALSGDTRAATMVALIQQLYQVERDATDAASRLRLRQERSKPILEQIAAERQRLEGEVLPKSPLGDAVRYLTNQWQALCRFAEDGSLQIDNNNAERQLRAVAVGRKNWLFSGSMTGAHRAAVIYSLIQSCRLVDVDPFAYLRDVLLRVATHPAERIAELTPRAWAQAARP